MNAREQGRELDGDVTQSRAQEAWVGRVDIRRRVGDGGWRREARGR
jgi:hypothetical protein